MIAMSHGSSDGKMVRLNRLSIRCLILNNRVMMVRSQVFLEPSPGTEGAQSSGSRPEIYHALFPDSAEVSGSAALRTQRRH